MLLIIQSSVSFGLSKSDIINQDYVEFIVLDNRGNPLWTTEKNRGYYGNAGEEC